MQLTMTLVRWIASLLTFALLLGVLGAKGRRLADTQQAPAQTQGPQSTYHLVRTVPLPFLKTINGIVAFEPTSRRLFIPDGKDLVVLDADTGARVGTIAKIGSVSVMAFVLETNQAFVVDGEHGSLTILDLQTLKTLEKVHAGAELSLVLYDPNTKQIFLTSSRHKDCTVVDATTRRVIRTVKLSGYVQNGLTDGKGHVYYDLSRDQMPETLVSVPGVLVSQAPPSNAIELAELDADTLKISNMWKEPCESIRLLGVDEAHARLVARCGGSLISIDEMTGKIVASAGIRGPFTWFLTYSSQLGDAFGVVAQVPTLALVALHENSAGDFTDPSATIAQVKDMQHIVFDDKNARVLILSSDQKMAETRVFIDRPTYDGGPTPLRVPEPVPGTFRVEVYGKN